jgi:hypothetical protein
MARPPTAGWRADTNLVLAPLLDAIEAQIALGRFVDMDEALGGRNAPMVAFDLAQRLEQGLQGEPTRAGAEVLAFMDRFTLRQTYVDRYGYAVPGPGTAFVDAVRPWGPILEVGAGTGTLGRLLRAAGVDCISTDAQPWTERGDVLAMDGEAALAAYPGRSVLCAWPGYQSGWLTALLARFQPGQRLLLVGEGQGGCTGDDALFETLATWQEVEVYRRAIWTWDGIHDRLTHHVAP